MNTSLYLVRDRGTRLHYLTGARPRRHDGGVDFTGIEARLQERGGVERVDPVGVFPLLRSLPSGDAEYFEVPPTWVVDHDVRQSLISEAERGRDV